MFPQQIVVRPHWHYYDRGELFTYLSPDLRLA